MNPFPFKDCPRYPTCSVNRCPLDPDLAKRKTMPGDAQRHCPMEVNVRLRIGAKYPDLLPMGGLTPKEYAGKQIWARYSTAEREAVVQRIKTASKPHRFKPIGK